MTHPLGGLPRLPTAQRYAGSQHTGVLPTGCMQCREGAKLVLFVTGLCDKECFYCPVSRDRMYRDVVFANERAVPIGDWDAITEEARLIDAKGAGITGGDPMVVPQRVVDLCTQLKATFGPQFHLHLYTSCSFDIAWIAKLKEAGLDEIRFHPEVDEYSAMADSWHDEAIREAIRVGLTTLCEVPCVPDAGDDLLALARYLESVGAHGLNMNELEFSPPNMKALQGRGYVTADDESQCVAGSRDTAEAVLSAWKRHRRDTGSSFAVHFCSSPYKDAIQLTQRFRRRAGNTARPFEEQTEEGTLVFGVLVPQDGLPGELAERLRSDYEVPAEWLTVVEGHVELAPWVAEELAEAGQLRDLGASGWISEVHPTAVRVEVERTPLGHGMPGAAA